MLNFKLSWPKFSIKVPCCKAKQFSRATKDIDVITVLFSTREILVKFVLGSVGGPKCLSTSHPNCSSPPPCHKHKLKRFSHEFCFDIENSYFYLEIFGRWKMWFQKSRFPIQKLVFWQKIFPTQNTILIHRNSIQNSNNIGQEHIPIQKTY